MLSIARSRSQWKQLAPFTSVLFHNTAAHSFSTKSQSKTDTEIEYMDFPGGKVPFTSTLSMLGGTTAPSPTIPCYRLIDATGKDIPHAHVPHSLDKDTALKIYKTLVSLQAVDSIFYEAQRQGRFSFYMTSNGEEATAVGSAAALSMDDVMFSQYREQGALMWRGFTPKDMADQCFGNENEAGKGRQMPIHYGSKKLNFHTISSPLATQLVHAAGAAYTMKLEGKKAVAAVYFGEGAASEGDFHAALNFAATLSCPVLFICRNNGWAISTPATEQYKGDGIACRGPSYGIATMRVDGSDVLAVYNTIHEARQYAVQRSSPVLIEAMSYRTSHHSTSDESSRYRAAEEMNLWRLRDPVDRYKQWLMHKEWLDKTTDEVFRRECRSEAIQALEEAEKVQKPPLSGMFDDVYDVLPWHLEEQKKDVFEFVKRHPEIISNLNIPLK